MKNILKFLFCSFVLLFVLSCTTRLGSFTVLSTRNIEWTRANEYKRGARVEGRDIAHIIIFIPTKLGVNIENAVDQALDKVPGAIALVDVVVKLRQVNVSPFYGQVGYIIEGSALIDPLLVSQEELEDSAYYIGVCDKKENVSIAKVSEDEYKKVSIKK